MRIGRVLLRGTPQVVAGEGGDWCLLDGDPYGPWTRGGAIVPADGQWLAPVAPTKVVCIGRNYRDHAAERGAAVPAEPMVFLKPPSAIVGPMAPIVMPPGVGRVDYEAELAVVIGRTARRVARAGAMAHVFGYTCLNDVTARDLQNRGVQFSHAKGYDTFAPVGPWIETDLDAFDTTVEAYVNGMRRQHGNTRDLAFPVDVLIEYISAIMTLEPGDVIATGTPAGIGPLAAGDTVTVRIEGIGELINPVAAGGEPPTA
jgi:2-keto-4-pentenoate hydratase/2-oxohepta-3-ene-1,7-dioic acid hydratase in catechol pathway